MLKAALINNPTTVTKTFIKMRGFILSECVSVLLVVCLSVCVCLVWLMSSLGASECDICLMFSQRHKRGFNHLNTGALGDRCVCVCVCASQGVLELVCVCVCVCTKCACVMGSSIASPVLLKLYNLLHTRHKCLGLFLGLQSETVLVADYH